ncbi:hypothetical protein [Parolsenella catena]|uniref:hypothetical protein n=1 Tax=Parolsenella catena TaxID=2003188 RepID=UPI002FDD2678
METSRQQEQQLRRMGREAVTKAIQAANANSGGMRRVTAKVTRVNSDYTVDVDMGDSAYSMPITGLRYTTSCFGVRVGDTVLVDVVGHLATVTGILATADNGPYVILYSSDARPGTYPGTVSGSVSIRQFAFLEIMGSTSEWTRCYCKVPGISFGDGTFGYDTMMFSLKAFNGGDKRAFIKMSRFVITDDGKSWSIGPKDYNELSAGGSVLNAIGPSVVRVIGWRA